MSKFFRKISKRKLISIASVILTIAIGTPLLTRQFWVYNADSPMETDAGKVNTNRGDTSVSKEEMGQALDQIWVNNLRLKDPDELKNIITDTNSAIIVAGAQKYAESITEMADKDAAALKFTSGKDANRILQQAIITIETQTDGLNLNDKDKATEQSLLDSLKKAGANILSGSEAERQFSDLAKLSADAIPNISDPTLKNSISYLVF